MTKHRAPLTIDAALARIAGQLPRGYDQMAEICGRQPRTVRNWGDPDTREQIPMDCAIALDLAYMADGGDGAPIFEAYVIQLELSEIERFGSRIHLGMLAAEIIRESGEAGSALVLASQPGATKAHFVEAKREVAEAVDALKRAIPVLEREMATGPPG